MNNLIAVLCQLKLYFRPFVQKYDPLWPDLSEEHPLYSLLQKRMTSLAKGTTEMDNTKWCYHINVPLFMNGNFKYLCSICSCLTTNRAPLCKLLFLILCANQRLRGSGLRSAGRIVLLRHYGFALSLHWLKFTSLIASFNPYSPVCNCFLPYYQTCLTRPTKFTNNCYHHQHLLYINREDTTIHSCSI